MVISLIAAMDRNRVIGKDNALPWRMPADLKRFRELTRGKPVIMGRKTHESIGRPLPERPNVVMTRDPKWRAEGCVVVRSVDEALKAAGNAPEIMIIGGAQIFKHFLPIANRMYLTLIDAEFEGDTFFPEFDEGEWVETEKTEYPADEQNPHPSIFIVLERRQKADAS